MAPESAPCARATCSTGLNQLKDALAAARALPGGLRAAARDWKAGIAAMGNEGHPAGEPLRESDSMSG